MYRKGAVKLKAESDLVRIKSDFMSQLKSTQFVDEILEYKSNNIEGDFMFMIKQKYGEEN